MTALPARDRRVIWGYVIAVIALAWSYLFYLDWQMSWLAQADMATSSARVSCSRSA